MILVTGGTGFVGSALVKELKKEGDVTIFSRKPMPHSITGDISDYSAVSRAAKDADVIFHLAAELDQFAPYKEHHKTTVRGTLNVMKAAEKTGAKVVYMSSNAVINRNKTNYSTAKAEAEEIARAYWGKINVPIIRASLIYDKDLIMKLKKVSYLPFPWKRGKIHPVYRGTLVQALIGAMKYGKSDIYPVADQRPILLTEFFKGIARPRPMLWIPPQVIWLGIAGAYPIEWIAKLTRTRPIVTPSFIRSLFEERVLDTKWSIKRLKYEPRDTLDVIKKIKSGDTEI